MEGTSAANCRFCVPSLRFEGPEAKPRFFGHVALVHGRMARGSTMGANWGSVTLIPIPPQVRGLLKLLTVMAAGAQKDVELQVGEGLLELL